MRAKIGEIYLAVTSKRLVTAMVLDRLDVEAAAVGRETAF